MEGTRTAGCVRCGRVVPLDSDEFLYGAVATSARWICAACLPAVGSESTTVEVGHTGRSPTDVGLGPSAVLDAGSDDERAMREALAEMVYEHPAGAP